MPTAVFTPVASMSTRFWIGIVQTFVQPGICTARSSSPPKPASSSRSIFQRRSRRPNASASALVQRVELGAAARRRAAARPAAVVMLAGGAPPDASVRPGPARGRGPASGSRCERRSRAPLPGARSRSCSMAIRVKTGAARSRSSPSSAATCARQIGTRRASAGRTGGSTWARARTRGRLPGSAGRRTRAWRRRRAAERPRRRRRIRRSRSAWLAGGVDEVRLRDERVEDRTRPAARASAGRELPAGPELPRAEVDHGLDHVHGRGVGRRLGPARLADHHVDLGEPAEDHVAGLQVVERLA